MKENPERMFGQKQERLTSKPRNLTLRSEGISMAEATQLREVPQHETTPQLTTSTEFWGESEAYRRTRADYLKWFSGREKRVTKTASELDIEIPEDLGEAASPQQKKHRELVLRFVDGVLQRRGKPSPQYIENFIAGVQVAVDNGEISPGEGDAFARDLQRLLIEAQDRQERTIIEEAKKIAVRAGLAGDLEKQDISIQGYFKDVARAQLNLQVNVPPGGGPGPAAPPFPGWIQSPGGIWGPPGGGGLPPGGVPPGGAGAAAGGGGAMHTPESEYVEQWIEYQRIRAELRIALGLEPSANQAAIHTALMTATPDLNDPIFADLNRIIDQLDVSKTYLFNWLSRDMANLKTTFTAPAAPAADLEVSEESRKLLFEAMYEKLVGLPDQGSPEKHYKIGSFYVMDLLDRLDNLAFVKFDRNYYHYISDLQHVRQVMHELNISLKYGEQYKEFILKELSASGMHFVYNDVAGINQVFEAYEKVSGSMVQRKREWLSDSDMAQIRQEVRTLFTGIPNVFTPVEMEKEGRRLTTWERDRALKMSEIFFAGVQRRGMYAFMGDLPPMAAGSARIASTQDVYIGRALMAGKQALQFFPGYKEPKGRFKEKDLTAAEGSREFIRLIVEEERKKIKQDHQELVNLFGLHDATLIFNHYGAYDLISHSWRHPKLFFDPIHYINAAGTEKTLFEDINELVRQYDPTRFVSFEPVSGVGELDKDAKRDIRIALRDIVLGQRLYLSTFVRHGNFDGEFKTDIWKKIAILKPSTIASLLPESLANQNQAVWEGLRLKLFAAELNRIKADEPVYLNPNQPRTMAQLTAERVAFEGALVDAAANNWGAVFVYAGLGNLNLTPAEQGVLGAIVQHGLANAEKLANAKMTFTVMVDDAPRISWKPSGRSFGGLSDADYIRLLASDQPTLQEGWNEGLNSLIENPTEGYIEKIKKVVTGYARVHGRDSAVATLRPLGIAWHKMSAMDWQSKWIPGVYALRKIIDQGSSIMTKYWRASKIEMDEEETKNSVVAVAQAIGASSTESRKMREETGSDVPMMLLFWFRTIMAILPPAMAAEFVKIMMPKLR